VTARDFNLTDTEYVDAGITFGISSVCFASYSNFRFWIPMFFSASSDKLNLLGLRSQTHRLTKRLLIALVSSRRYGKYSEVVVFVRPRFDLCSNLPTVSAYSASSVNLSNIIIIIKFNICIESP
jgi:hypothetical protein